MSAGQKWLPVIDPARCSGCAACATFCPTGSLAVVVDRAVLVNAAACKSEARCVRACPEDAIEMAWRPIGRTKRKARRRSA